LGLVGLAWDCLGSLGLTWPNSFVLIDSHFILQL
jgi:hypothetical protein